MSRMIISAPILKESASEGKYLNLREMHSWHLSNYLNYSIILPLQYLKFILDFGKKK